ncbi:PAS domain-containing sensor histidine kinase [Paraburkholderia lycopersici]|uniref:PAS domain S-box-containing protein n=1 Tax=Paraburkholderia lycopersici TaxID=416944 RepID=A0A1G6SDD0_9BURK|nr:PAS domain S-box protein [Paraburkholderia lycopersici]SDD14879.1 PAS domain S-box-containing protein [Paraburkholderia lycopersici]
MQTARPRSWLERNHSEIAIVDRYRLLIDAVRDYAIFMLEPGGRVASWNPGARRIKGYFSDEIIGTHFSVFYTSDEIASGKPEQLLEAAAFHGRVEDEGWRVRKDGSRFWANVVITAVRDDKNALVGFAKITRDLTERRRLEALERAHVASALVEQARENEQKRIARELHDDLGQRIAALKMALGLRGTEFASALPAQTRAERQAVAQIGPQIDALAVAVRRIAADLRPAVLDDLGLEAALEWLAEDFGGRYGVAVQCELDVSEPDLGEFASTALFRVVQEALTNVARHARAHHVTIALKNDGNQCRFRISDDGAGFDPLSVSRPDAFGLIGMRERIVQLGGSLTVEGRPGAGVTLSAAFRLPVDIRTAAANAER